MECDPAIVEAQNFDTTLAAIVICIMLARRGLCQQKFPRTRGKILIPSAALSMMAERRVQWRATRAQTQQLAIYSSGGVYMSSEYKVVTPANAGSNKYIYVSGKTYYKSNTDWDESDDTSSFDAVTSCPPDPGYAPNCTTCPTRSQLASNCGTTARLRFSGDDLYFICNDDPFTSTNLLNNTDFDLTLDSVAAQYQLFYNGCITMTLFCTSGQWYLNLDGNMGPSITNIPLGYAIQPNCCPPSGGTHTVTGYSKTFTLTFP